MTSVAERLLDRIKCSTNGLSMSRPKVIGITGTIGAGKSLVGKLLQSRGLTVFDTDALVHQLFASNSELKRAIANRFGPQVLTVNKDIDRNKLGTIVFNDDEARKDLEAIVHPAVVQECQRLIGENGDKPFVFFLVPLLFEAGLAERYDKIWTVVTEEQILKERLQARTNLPADEIEKRLAAQMPQERKAALAGAVIDNSGTMSETERQLDALLADVSQAC